MDDWQCGYELADLKRLGAPFRGVRDRLKLGAFGFAKEAEVAKALKTGAFHQAGDAPGAVAITKRPSRPHHAFSRDITLPADTLVISDFAVAEYDAGMKLLAGFDGPVFAEAFEEDLVSIRCLRDSAQYQDEGTVPPRFQKLPIETDDLG